MESCEHDIETLRLIHADLRDRRSTLVDLLDRERTRMLGIVTSTGLVTSLFVVFRPKSAGRTVDVLYAAGLAPFLVIVVISIVYTVGLWSGRLGFAADSKAHLSVREQLHATETAPRTEREWLLAQIDALRDPKWPGIPKLHDLVMRRRKLMGVVEILFGAEVAWLVAVSLARLLG